MMTTLIKRKLSLSYFNRKNTLIIIVVLSTLGLPYILSLYLDQRLNGFQNIALHSTLEAAGAVMAFTVALFIYLLHRRYLVFGHYNWAGLGLMGMGIFEIVHAFMPPGELFVWFFATNVLVGGLLFSFVWIKNKKLNANSYFIIPTITILFLLLTVLISFISPEALPKMINNKDFTNIPIAFNLIGGVGFFVAGIYFILHYYQYEKMDDLLFVGLTLLFGISGVLFATSQVWSPSWWLWHYLRFFAFLIALYYTYLLYSRKSIQLYHENEKLGLEILEKNKKQIAQAKQTQNYLDIARVLIMALDNNKNIIMINQEGANILGCSKEEIIGKNFVENFLPKNIKEEISKVAEDIIEENDGYSEYENPIVTKSGEERLIAWKNHVLTDEDGNVYGILTSGEDVTEKKEREKMLLLHTKQAQMGEMIGMIAHQWRQPLAAIAATTSSLKLKQSLGSYEEEYFSEQLDKIENYTQHLSETIDDFRNFLKDDKQKININPTNIINSAIDIVKAIFTNRGIELRTNFLSNVELSVYPNELVQVILNLLTNAREVIEEREVKEPIVDIETYEKDDKYHIAIKDNAGGVADDIIDKVFDPYFTTKDGLNGTGLGLYMSKTIIEEHCQGRMVVKNVDDGALFLISLNRTY